MKHDNRFERLTAVLQYDSYGEKKLTAFERMDIHRERAAIIGGTSGKVPEALEEKIQAILQIIDRLQWESPFKQKPY